MIELKGTEKQINWANDIRESYINSVNREIERVKEANKWDNEHIEHSLTMDERNRCDALLISMLEIAKELTVKTLINASDWIEKKPRIGDPEVRRLISKMGIDAAHERMVETLKKINAR